MAVINLNKDITHVVATAGVWTLTLSDVEGCQVGMHADIGGMPTASWNVLGEEITAVDTVNKTVQYTHGNFTVASQDITTAILHIETSWCDTAYVEVLIGFTPTDAADIAYLEACTDAANDWAFIRRAAAGYTDHPNIAAGSNVRLGTALYALGLWRERGSVDSFQSFQDVPLAGAIGSMGQINKLLGIPRPGVA